jgi:hypothetical protein
MTRLLLLGVLSLGMTCIAVGQNGQGQNGDNQGGRAPEIDPTQAVSAIALLGGTTLVIRGRQRK